MIVEGRVYDDIYTKCRHDGDILIYQECHIICMDEEQAKQLILAIQKHLDRDKEEL